MEKKFIVSFVLNGKTVTLEHLVTQAAAIKAKAYETRDDAIMAAALRSQDRIERLADSVRLVEKVFA